MAEKVLYLDTETLEIETGIYTKHVFKLGWTCYCIYDQQSNVVYEDWKEWKDRNLLCGYIDEICKLEKPLYLFAHNVFFDLQVIEFFRWFTRKGYSLNFYYDMGLSYILSIRRRTHLAWCLSTTNYFEVSLKKIGDFVGLEKLEVDFGKASDKELSIYCHRDVEIIKKAMEYYYKFILEFELGKFSYTKSSQSLCSYRKRFMNTKIYLHTEADIKELERASYMGGRVECFQLGKIPGSSFTSLDFNSMFPYIMKFTNVPTKLINYREDVKLNQVEDIVKTFCVVAEAEVETDIPIYAKRHNKKVVFPTGDFTCFLCTEGIKEALKRGHLKKVKRLAVYQRGMIFKEYVDFFYNLKVKYLRENNLIMTQLVKLFLNSLYGKFAQKSPVQEITKDYTFEGFERREIYNLRTGEKWIEYKMFNTKVIEKGFEEGPNSFVAVSSHITEAARLRLWRLIEVIGTDKVLYCDTDSVIIHSKDISIVSDYLSEDKLGYLKIDDKTKALNIIGLKSYITDSKRVLKGVPKRAVEISPGIYKYQAFLKQKTHMKHEVEDGILTKWLYKTIQTNYDKGYVLNTGRVIPFQFSQQQPLSEQPQLPF